MPSIASTQLVDRVGYGIDSNTLAMWWGGHACNVTHAQFFNEFVPAWLAGEVLPEE